MYHKIKNKIEFLAAYIILRIILFNRVSGRVKIEGNIKKIDIHRSFRCEGDLWLGIYNSLGSITISENVKASGPLIITSINKVFVGQGVLFGPNILVTDHYHGNPKSFLTFLTPPSVRKLYSSGPVYIGDNVHVGANVCIFSPCHIGSYSIIGANSVVKGEYSDRVILGGVPARLISKVIDDK